MPSRNVHTHLKHISGSAGNAAIVEYCRQYHREKQKLTSPAPISVMHLSHRALLPSSFHPLSIQIRPLIPQFTPHENTTPDADPTEALSSYQTRTSSTHFRESFKMSDAVTLKRKAQQCLVELEKVSTPYERTFTYIEAR